jgi:L-rhamnose isomerase
MSRLNNALHNDFAALRLLRDELSLQSSLLKAEARERWFKLESDYDVLGEHLQRAEVAAQDSKAQIEAAAALLLESLRAGYTDIRNTLKH